MHAVFTCLCSIAGVKCIYACVGSTEAELEGTLDILRAAKALDNTAVLCAPLGATIGEKLATISAACSLGGERLLPGRWLRRAFSAVFTLRPVIRAHCFMDVSSAERVRDEGGHALVVLDTVKPLVDAWGSFVVGLSGLGRREVRGGW